MTVETPKLEKTISAEVLPDGTDLNKLAYAVAMAETGDCTTGIGPKKFNCFGVKGHDGYMKTYGSKEESYADFKRIWSKYYKKFPNWSLANTWTGGDSVETWLAAVKKYY